MIFGIRDAGAAARWIARDTTSRSNPTDACLTDAERVGLRARGLGAGRPNHPNIVGIRGLGFGGMRCSREDFDIVSPVERTQGRGRSPHDSLEFGPPVLNDHDWKVVAVLDHQERPAIG